MKSLAKFFALTLVLAHPLGAAPIPDGKPHRLELKGGSFVIDGEPVRIVAGEMHLPRVLPEFWDDRIKKAKAMGLNAVSLYVMWNMIEPKEGEFDFTGGNDVRRFAKLCQENGIWLILRPGPYVCAEWEWGGLPAWLLPKKIELRISNPQKLECDRRYLKKLAEQLADLQIHRGGPILMTQVENEHSPVLGEKYMTELTQIFREVGFDGQLFTCNPGKTAFAALEEIPGVLRGVNGVDRKQDLYELAKQLADKSGYPVYCAEVYTSWFSQWGTAVKRKPIEKELDTAKWLLDRNINYCYYLFHGATNWGFMAMDATITSYNYDAPVDEIGRITPKYKALREFFTKELNLKLPPIPPDPKVIGIAPFKLARQCSLLDVLPEKPVVADDVLGMEYLGQAYGFVLYRKQFPNGIKGVLDLKKTRDYCIVMINGDPVGRAYSKYGPESMKVALNHSGPCTLDILTHNMGRQMPAAAPREGRGLVEDPTLDGEKVKGWEMYSLPLENPSRLPPGQAAGKGPAFYRGTFTLTETGETYLDMRNFGFGAVWVNGHNLGRYWDVGATRSLYLPSPWQKKGKNEIVVLELKDNPPKALEIMGTTDMIEEAPIPFPKDEKPKI